MTITLTKEQDTAVRGINEWYKAASKPECILTGYAGTGKTFLVNHIISDLKLKPEEVAFVAYTGKASLLLKKANPRYQCGTIHQLVYTLDIATGTPVFVLKSKEQLKKLKLIVVDEASMVGNKMKADLLSFGIPVLFIGDEGQLPAVGDDCILLDNPDFRLTEIHRQAEGNSIIHLSMLAREKKRLKPGAYGKNAYVLSKNDFNPERLTQACLRADQILCGKNDTRKMLNQKVRRIKGFKSPFPQVGDKMICTKNSWDTTLNGVSLVNGMTGYIEDVRKAEKTSTIKRDCLSVNFRPDFVENSHFKDLLLIEDDFRDKHVMLKGDDYRRYQKMEFGEAITVHKAQGGSYERVLVFNEVCELPKPS